MTHEEQHRTSHLPTGRPGTPALHRRRRDRDPRQSGWHEGQLAAHGRCSRQPAARAAPVSAASLAATIEQQTGEDPSQLSTQYACGTPTASRVECLAKVLVSARSGDPVAPRVGHTPSSIQPVPGVFSPSVAVGEAPAAEPAATMPPPPGTPAFLQQAYDLGYLSTTGGVGDTIAIVDSFDDPNAASDLQVFRSQFWIAGVRHPERLLHQGQPVRAGLPIPASRPHGRLGGRRIA